MAKIKTDDGHEIECNWGSSIYGVTIFITAPNGDMSQISMSPSVATNLANDLRTIVNEAEEEWWLIRAKTPEDGLMPYDENEADEETKRRHTEIGPEPDIVPGMSIMEAYGTPTEPMRYDPMTEGKGWNKRKERYG